MKYLTAVLALAMAVMAVQAVPQQTAFEKSVGCALCQGITKEVAALVAKGETNIQTFLDSICGDLGPLKGICEGIINTELPKIVAWLEDGQNELEICQKLGLCPALSVARKIVPVQSKPMVKEANVKGVGCSICHEVVKLVSDMAGEDEQTIIDAVNGLCDDLGPLASVCKSLADGAVDDIIKWLADGNTADEICSKLGMCSTLVKKPEPVKAPTDDLCANCKTIVHAAKGKQDSGESFDQAKTELLEMCKDLGGTDAGLCTTFVNNFGTQVWQWLKDGQSETQICGKVGLCATPPVRSEPQPKGIGCSICKELVKLVASMIGDTEAEIIAAVNLFCDDLGPLAGVCKKLADGAIKEIIQWLKDGDNETEICQKLTLCDALGHNLLAQKLMPAFKA